MIKLTFVALLIVAFGVSTQTSVQPRHSIDLIILIDRSPSVKNAATDIDSKLFELKEYLEDFAENHDSQITIAGANFGNKLGETVGFQDLREFDAANFLPDEEIPGTDFIEPIDHAIIQFSGRPAGTSKAIILLTDGQPDSESNNVLLSDVQKNNQFNFIQTSRETGGFEMLVLALSGVNDESPRWLSFLDEDSYITDFDDLKTIFSRFFLGLIGVDVDSIPKLTNLVVSPSGSNNIRVSVSVESWNLLPVGFTPTLTVDSGSIASARMLDLGEGQFEYDFDGGSGTNMFQIAVEMSTVTIGGIPVNSIISASVPVPAQTNPEPTASVTPTHTPTPSIKLDEIQNSVTPTATSSNDESTTSTINSGDENKTSASATNQNSGNNIMGSEILLMLERLQLLVGVMVSLITNLLVGFYFHRLSSESGQKQRLAIADLDASIDRLALGSEINKEINKRVEPLQQMHQSVHELVKMTRQLPELYGTVTSMASRLQATATLQEYIEIIRKLERIERKDKSVKVISELLQHIRDERIEISKPLDRLEDQFLIQNEDVLRSILKQEIERIPERLAERQDWSEHLVASVNSQMQQWLQSQSDRIKKQLDEGLRTVEDNLEKIQTQQATLSADMRLKLNEQKKIVTKAFLQDRREEFKMQLIANANSLIENEKERIRASILNSFKNLRAAQRAFAPDPDSAISSLSSEEILHLARRAVNLLSYQDIVSTITDESFVEQNLRISFEHFIAYAMDELASAQNQLSLEVESDQDIA